MANVRLQRVKKSFGKIEVVHGIECEIQDGEFVVILGPSGCGKSTILRMIAGLEDITHGEIILDGKVINQLEPADRDMAMVFQNYALYPHMSVYQNMAYGLKIRRIPKGEIDRRVRQAAEILGLIEYLHRKPRELSGGQRQRVAMGRCIVREPKVFLFDEPLSNLDAKLRVQMRLEIRKLHEDLKVTSIYVTHDQIEAMTLADRLMILESGSVAQIGTPLEVYERPANLFVAGFIGSPAMNFLPARLAADGRSVHWGSYGVFPLAATPTSPRENLEVTLGIRPEHLRVVNEENSQIRLQVERVETLGADTLIYGRCPGDTTLLTILLRDIQRLGKGAVLPLCASPQNLHLFQRESGKRISP